MAYIIENQPHAIAVKYNDPDKLSRGVATNKVIPKEAVAFNRGGDNQTYIDFREGGTDIIQINTDNVYLKDSPTSQKYPWNGTVDELLYKLNNEYLVPSTTNTNPSTPPTNMPSIVDIYTWSDLPSPDTNNIITLKEGFTYNVIGTIDPLDGLSKVTLPKDVTIFIESNVTLKGQGYKTTGLFTEGFTQPPSQQGAPSSLITIGADKAVHIKNIIIDGANSKQKLVEFLDKPNSVHEWSYVSWRNGDSAVSFTLNNMESFSAFKCDFINTGGFLVFETTATLSVFSMDSCHIQFQNATPDSNFLSFSKFCSVTNYIKIHCCTGDIGTVSTPNNFINIEILSINSRTESIVITDNRLNIVNGLGFKSYTQSFTVDNKQALFKGNVVDGLEATFVGAFIEKVYPQNLEAETTPAINADFEIKADLSGINANGGIDTNINNSRLFEIVIINDISYLRYIGSVNRRFALEVEFEFLATGYRRLPSPPTALTLKIKKGTINDQNSITSPAITVADFTKELPESFFPVPTLFEQKIQTTMNPEDFIVLTGFCTEAIAIIKTNKIGIKAYEI